MKLCTTTATGKVAVDLHKMPENRKAEPQLAPTGRGTHPGGLRVKALVPVGLSATRKLSLDCRPAIR